MSDNGGENLRSVDSFAPGMGFQARKKKQEWEFRSFYGSKIIFFLKNNKFGVHKKLNFTRHEWIH